MVQFSFVATLISTSLAALMLLFGLAGAKSAPQEASIAAMACAMAIIPYVFTRCLQIGEDRKAQAAELKRIADLLESRGSLSPAQSPTAPPSIRTSDDAPAHSKEAPTVQRTNWS